MDIHKYEEEEFKGGMDWGLWRKVAAFVGPYRACFFGLLFIVIILAGAEVAFAQIVRFFVDAVAEKKMGTSFSFYTTLFVADVTIISMLVFFLIRWTGYLTSRLSHDIRKAGFEKLQRFSFAYYDQKSVGWLMARMTSDCERLSLVLSWNMVDVVWGCALMSGMAVTMLCIHWPLALCVITLIPLLAMVSLYFQKKMLMTSRKVSKKNSEVTAAFNEALMGIRTTKTLVREERNLHEFKKITEDMKDHGIRNAMLSAVYFPIILVLSSAGIALALCVGGQAVMAGTLTMGSLILFLFYAREFFHPILEIARIFAEWQVAQASAERIMGLVNTEPDIVDSDVVLEAMANMEGKTLDPGQAYDGGPAEIVEVEFKQVSYAYQDGPQVLHDFSLKVARGQTVALVGETGGGKSTIANLLCRFYEPRSGSISLNGTDYRERSLAWLQSNLGIVLQEPHLFSGSVIENIRYGRLDATDEEVYQAARMVKAHAFIEEMEDAYDTEVGEGGSRLSRGQKQLVSFARALLADPQIFVMDEATSAVDTNTEVKIQEGLEAILKGRISFIIAHRLSTIRKADIILVISDGRIVEQGNHKSLLANQGAYAELYSKQFQEG